MKNMTMELCTWNVTVDNAEGINVRSSSFHLRNEGITISVIFLNGEITIKNKEGEFILSVYNGVEVGDKTVLSIKSQDKPVFRYKNFWFTIEENIRSLSINTNKPDKESSVDDKKESIDDDVPAKAESESKPIKSKSTKSKPKVDKPKIEKEKSMPKVDKAPKELPPIKGGKRVIRRTK